MSKQEVQEFIDMIARMKTESEMDEESNGEECMSGDDAVETLSDLIHTARELQSTKKMLTCDMTAECTCAVTHIGNKGYVYCTQHAAERRASSREHCRKMRAWEINTLASGGQISYTPTRKPGVTA
jgi:hypothetical protein